jgi:serine protease
VQGQQTVDLSWTGATSSSIDIYGNGVLIVTVPNNGFYTDAPNGRGHATYSYKVCEAGTGNCSNQVAVNFEIPVPTQAGTCKVDRNFRTKLMVYN